MTDIKKAAADTLEKRMGAVATKMADDMKMTLSANGHIDTGSLIHSVSARTEQKPDEVIAYIDITAESEEGAWYAEFIEFGTGKFNKSGDGRKTPWIWKPKPGSKYYKLDENGEVVRYRTEGMKADPFIRPAVMKYIGELEEAVIHSYDLKRYRGMNHD